MGLKNKKCACCGQETLPPGSIFEICEVCEWQDDPVQNADTDYAGGANEESLNQYRASFFKNQN